jgi:hypothetical protein
MIEKSKRIVLAAVTTVVGVLGMTSVALPGMGDSDRGGGEVSVRPCSLAGINPVHHPEIFGNPATAGAYGFVQAQDGSWRVAPNCRAK